MDEPLSHAIEMATEYKLKSARGYTSSNSWTFIHKRFEETGQKYILNYNLKTGQYKLRLMKHNKPFQTYKFTLN